jgi:hypothetical protein
MKCVHAHKHTVNRSWRFGDFIHASFTWHNIPSMTDAIVRETSACPRYDCQRRPCPRQCFLLSLARATGVRRRARRGEKKRQKRCQQKTPCSPRNISLHEYMQRDLLSISIHVPCRCAVMLEVQFRVCVSFICFFTCKDDDVISHSQRTHRHVILHKSDKTDTICASQQQTKMVLITTTSCTLPEASKSLILGHKAMALRVTARTNAQTRTGRHTCTVTSKSCIPVRPFKDGFASIAKSST